MAAAMRTVHGEAFRLSSVR